MNNAQGLVIGIANYQHINPLPSTVLQDARDVHSLLTDPNVCGYPASNVHLLLDQDATLTGLRQALSDLAARCNAESTVFLYISSHGGRILQGANAGEYLLPVDTKLKPDVRPAALNPATALSGDEFTAYLQAIPARKVVVLFDCCHSGGIGGVSKATDELVFKTGLPESYYDRLAAGRGRVILSSSRDSELSWILRGDANSLFTKHLKAGLLGGAPNREGFIHIFDLFEYIHPRVTAAHSQQHPVLQVRLEENFPVALYLGGQKSPVPESDSEDEDEFRYDAYISWVRAPEDTRWLREQILPRLRQAGLRVAMTGRVEEPGIPAVVGVERAVAHSRRTVLLLSQSYLQSESGWPALESTIAQHLGVEERRARLLPVVIDDALLDRERYLNQDVPLGLRQLSVLDVVDDLFGEENLNRLPQLLTQSIPTTGR